MNLTIRLFALVLIVAVGFAETELPNGAKKPLPPTDVLRAEIEGIQASIMRLSEACAGEAAVAPLYSRLDELREQWEAGTRDHSGNLDQGGDICANATIIGSWPYTDVGTTVGFTDNYTPPCDPTGSAPDVVYLFQPTTTVQLDVSLCASSFNTVLSIWRSCPGSDEPIMDCCNDDSPDCGPQSCCPAITFAAGYTYYIIVDGAGSASGAYQLVLDLPIMPSCGAPMSCVSCPPGASYENELCPATWPDPNAGPGCFGSGTEPISCGQTYCGKATHTTSWLDKDAYLVTLTQRDSIRFCIIAEFGFTVSLYQYSPG